MTSKTAEPAAVVWIEVEALEHLQRLTADLRETLAMGVAVVEDFMPNIGRCALQDYGRLNDFLIKSAKLAKVQS